MDKAGLELEIGFRRLRASGGVPLRLLGSHRVPGYKPLSVGVVRVLRTAEQEPIVLPPARAPRAA